MIAAENISLVRNGRQILHSATLQFREPGFVAIIGPNGAGKSTLLHLLSGLMKPSTGFVALGQRPLSSWKTEELAMQRAYLQQQHSVFETFTVNDVLTMGRSVYFKFRPSAQDGELVTEMLKELDLLHRKDQPFNQLSGGEQQRVQFARTILQLFEGEDRDMKGKFLFLDEPLNNLDLHYQVNLLQMAREMIVARGGTVIAVLHDLNMTQAFADRVIILEKGAVRADDLTEKAMSAELLSEIYNVPITRLENEGQVFFHVSPQVSPEKIIEETKKYIYS
jgi:iron complex transport system ATP-binding protein